MEKIKIPIIFISNAFWEKTFLHLLGIDSANMNATEFYDKCDMYNNGRGDGITIADCNPSRNHNCTTCSEGGTWYVYYSGSIKVLIKARGDWS